MNRFIPHFFSKTVMTTLIAASLSACHQDNDDDDVIIIEPVKTVQTLRGEITLAKSPAETQFKVLSGTTEVANSKSFNNGNFLVETMAVTEQQLEQLRIETRVCSDILVELSCTVLSTSVTPGQLNSIIQVDVRSTLVDRLSQQKNLSLVDAEKRVSHYLMLSEDLTSQDGVDPNLFDAARFVSDHLMEANKAGISLDAQINKTVDQIAADATLQHQYKPLLGLNPLVKGIGIELAKGAVGAIGGELMGKALSFMGLGSDFEASERHNEIMAQLGQVNQKLDLMSTQINQIQSGVQETLRQIEKIDVKLESAAQQQRIQQLLTQTTALAEYVEQVKIILFDLQNAHQLSSALQPSERTRLKTAIESLMTKRTLISATLNGTVGNASMIENLINVEFPQSSDLNKTVFFGPKVVNTIQNYLQYYDDINTMAYYLNMEYYNALDQENNIGAQDCPDTLSASVTYKRQCVLFHELKTARNNYLALAPQAELPISGMFINVYQAYRKDILPYVIYPVGDFNYINFNNNTGTTQAVLVRLTENLGIQTTVRDEALNLANWMYMENSIWNGLFGSPAFNKGTVKDVAVANGAPASAFVTATGDYAVWVNDPSGQTRWSRRLTTSNAVENNFDNAKFMVLGQLKNISEVEKYMGKVIANRFK